MSSIVKVFKHKTDGQANGPIPVGHVGRVLNLPSVESARTTMDGDDYILHVSGLIRGRPEDLFCPRELALKHVFKGASKRSVILPGQEIVFNTGHEIHRTVTLKFLKTSKYSRRMYGVWSCPCGYQKHTGLRPVFSLDNICKRCRKHPTQYGEYTLFLPHLRLVGHPDLLLLDNHKRLYIYEIKTVDRRDVDFGKLSKPLPDHILQTSFYYHMAIAEGFKVYSKLRFIYVDRSSRVMFESYPFKELEIEPYPYSRIAPFVDYAREVAAFVDNPPQGKHKKLPKRLSCCASVSSKRAAKCPMAVICFSRSDDLVYVGETKKSKEAKGGKTD